MADPTRSRATQAAYVLRMSEDQKQQLAEVAEAAGVTVRAWVMHNLFGTPLGGGPVPRHSAAARAAGDNQPALIEGGPAAA